MARKNDRGKDLMQKAIAFFLTLSPLVEGEKEATLRQERLPNR